MSSLMTAASLEPLATAGSEGVYRLCGAAGPGRWHLPVFAGRAAPGPGGQLPEPPGGQRLYQRRGHHHCQLPAFQALRRLRRQGPPPLRNDHPGLSSGHRLHPLALSGHGRGRLRNHDHPQKDQPQDPLRSGGRRRHHLDLLGRGFPKTTPRSARTPLPIRSLASRSTTTTPPSPPSPPWVSSGPISTSRSSPQPKNKVNNPWKWLDLRQKAAMLTARIDMQKGIAHELRDLLRNHKFTGVKQAGDGLLFL